MRLTALELKQTKPQASNVKLYDGGGLYLLIQTNGARYRRMRYRYAEKEKLLAIGVYPETTLAKAREKRDSARKRLATGADTFMERKEEKRLLTSEARRVVFRLK